MLIHAARPLFAWSELEDSPSLQTIRAVLSSLPDKALLDGLQKARGQGRDDYPVRVLVGRRRARRPVPPRLAQRLPGRAAPPNPTLCALLGIRRVVDIPKPHNLSRFLDVLGQPAHLRALRDLFDTLVKALPHRLPGTSCPARVAKARQAAMLAASVTNRMLPSHSSRFTPPVCQLRAAVSPLL